MLRARIIAPGGSDDSWRLRDDRQKIRLGGFTTALFRQRQSFLSRFSPPTPDLLRTNLPTARDLRHRRARLPRLGDNLALLFRRLTPPPRRSRQHLNPTEGTLRVVVNYVHNHRSIDKPTPTKHFLPAINRRAAELRLPFSVGPG